MKIDCSSMTYIHKTLCYNEFSLNKRQNDCFTLFNVCKHTINKFFYTRKENTVKIDNNQDLFVEKQEDFTLELIRTIRRALECKGLDEQAVYDLTSSISFNVTALIDGSATSGEQDNPTVSYLAFREKEESLDSIITSPVGSYVHEISEGFVENEFEQPN